MTDPILFSVHEGLARITLNRPTRLNAFDEATARAWERITAEAVARDDVGAILLDAEGPSFCAGGDVLGMAAGGFSADGITELAGVINRGILSLIESDKPVVAAAQGTTAGGGLGILLASDYAVVGEDSRIGSLYANMGLTPDLSVTAQLHRAVGQRRALQLVLQDRLLSAAEAVEWGLVAEAVAPDQVRARGEEIARFWLAGASAAYGQAKRLVRAAPEQRTLDQLGDEARTIGAALATPEAQARVAAFAAASARKAAR
ncbi:enoyl-CoA hydratase/isomerase family protein [Microbacterium rhizomatis]|uniref:Enoyl-CoA hydratase/isomerase family protein n=1 Tax=Microbacterium rhizomatis TaxID=1631477 RepID=A0A5J5J4Q3_9MICO|nr:enoyl-CoA hydratase/isomerase family protein [Microbacterium rhizomatis]KAA9108258.1 enoyl-CoA hydratase/isomerase family protein [Microbacterium rhizomatis]